MGEHATPKASRLEVMLRVMGRAAPRVLLVEGQSLIGKALCAVLSSSPEIDVLGDLAAVPTLPDEHLLPDIVLIDIDGLSEDVAEAIRRAVVMFARARICCLTSFAREEVLQRCLASGADGYILKESNPSELTRALVSVAAGNPYVDPRVAGNLLRRRSAANWRAEPDDLLRREVEIVCLIARGYSNKSISEKLQLSEKTVKNYVSQIFTKLGFTARTQAAAYAYRNGMV